MIDYAAIGKRIQKKRQERSITQEKLAEQGDLHQVDLTIAELSKDLPDAGDPFQHLHRAGHGVGRGVVQHRNGAERLRQ